KEGPKKAAFDSEGFDLMRKREAPILAGERQRLLYVAATRARDLLVIPLPDSTKKPPDESFLGDLAKGNALPDGAALAGAPDRARIPLPTGARAGGGGIGASRRGAAPGDRHKAAPPGRAPRGAPAVLAAWRRERDALLGEASRPPAFLTASGRNEPVA